MNNPIRYFSVRYAAPTTPISVVLRFGKWLRSYEPKNARSSRSVSGSDRSISYEALFDGITLKFVTSSHPTPKNDSSVGLSVTFFYPI